HDLAMEHFVPVRFDHAREQLVLAVLARGIADRALFFRQQSVETQRVFPGERCEVAFPLHGDVVHASLSSTFGVLRRRSSMKAGTSSPKPRTEGPPSS